MLTADASSGANEPHVEPPIELPIDILSVTEVDYLTVSRLRGLSVIEPRVGMVDLIIFGVFGFGNKIAHIVKKEHRRLSVLLAVVEDVGYVRRTHIAQIADRQRVFVVVVIHLK